jgi:hypothetical protein
MVNRVTNHEEKYHRLQGFFIDFVNRYIVREIKISSVQSVAILRNPLITQIAL